MFRDLADLSQWIVEPPRSSTMATWRSKNLLSVVTLGPIGLGAVFKAGGGRTDRVAILLCKANADVERLRFDGLLMFALL